VIFGRTGADIGEARPMRAMRAASPVFGFAVFGP
jgi:hypothetical protein